MTRCPGHGNGIQQPPSRAVSQIGTTTQADCRGLGVCRQSQDERHEQNAPPPEAAVAAEALHSRKEWSAQSETGPIRAHYIGNPIGASGRAKGHPHLRVSAEMSRSVKSGVGKRYTLPERACSAKDFRSQKAGQNRS